ncbi:MAG: glycosyltransferase family 4 protein [Planctomycetota bacterium]|nr:glycosyltransferase family 4 protein [Planctomycetota bacterium]
MSEQVQEADKIAMQSPSTAHPAISTRASAPSPVFGFLAFTSGSYEGAIVRDMRLANVLHRRGFKVHIYWLMETNSELVDKEIPQHTLARFIRYWRRKPSGLLDTLGGALNIFNATRRRRFAQQHPAFVPTLLRNFARSMCDISDDPGIVSKLENFMMRDGVTHLLPTFTMTCPIALAVKERGRHTFEYLPTFQGEEIFSNYAQDIGRLDDFHAQLRRCVAASPWPAVAVSDDYAVRLQEEIALKPEQLVTIYPGIELPTEQTKPSFDVLTERFPGLNPKIPIVSYFGRQDTEKGLDLLLYSVRLLRDRGVPFQLLISGGSSFGWAYQEICRQIADHLRLQIFWKRRVTHEVRTAIYAYSRCIVYPSIHREPFGMVAAETMSHGTPVIVPNLGGITEAIRANGKIGGLMFNVWDTRDLADQIQRILTDDVLYSSLASNTREIARTFSAEVMADRVLAHLGLPLKRE